MSTSFLFHAFNLKGIKYKSTKYKGNQIIFNAEMTSSLAKCPECGSKNVIYKGIRIRKLRLPPCAQKKLFLVLIVHRLQCKTCNKIRWPYLPFAPGKQRYTTSFAAFVLDLLNFSTIKDASQLVGTGWDLVKAIHKKKLTTRYKNIKLDELEYIAIDEFSIGKRHKYMTIVIDLQTGRIIHAVEGKSKKDIFPFLKKLSQKAKRLRAVAIDMGAAYFAAVTEAFDNIDIVFDHFHVTKLLNDALDDFRRDLNREYKKVGKDTLVGSRFLILSNPENLEKDKQSWLHELLRVNEPLFVMYSMKEQLRLFWGFKKKLWHQSF